MWGCTLRLQGAGSWSGPPPNFTGTLAGVADARFLGHAAAEYAPELARRAGVRTLALFHHHPQRNDDEVDAIETSLVADDLVVVAAREGGRFAV